MNDLYEKLDDIYSFCAKQQAAIYLRFENNSHDAECEFTVEEDLMAYHEYQQVLAALSWLLAMTKSKNPVVGND